MSKIVTTSPRSVILSKSESLSLNDADKISRSPTARKQHKKIKSLNQLHEIYQQQQAYSMTTIVNYSNLPPPAPAALHHKSLNTNTASNSNPNPSTLRGSGISPSFIISDDINPNKSNPEHRLGDLVLKSRDNVVVDYYNSNESITSLEKAKNNNSFCEMNYSTFDEYQERQVQRLLRGDSDSLHYSSDVFNMNQIRRASAGVGRKRNHIGFWDRFLSVLSAGLCLS